MKVVLNKCYGGYGLSLKGKKRLGELQGQEIYFYKQTKYNFKDKEEEYAKITDLNGNDMFVYALTKDLGAKTNKIPSDVWFKDCEDERNNSLLVQVIEELENEASGSCSQLQVIEIPDGIEYEVEEYDGMEWIAEKHQVWG